MNSSSSSAPKVLVIDDEPDLRTLYEVTLVREGYVVDAAADVAQARQCLQETAYQLVLTDMRLPDGTGMDVVRWLEAERRAERVIVITAFGSAENAVEALKRGAFDYLTKPVDLRQFRTVVASALGRGGASVALNASSGSPPARAEPFPSADNPALARVVGQSPAMQALRERLLKVARTMAPVLITGESGTGKELAARAVHEASPRRLGAFIAVNCGAIPEALLEAEFFGYRKGAFTGAQEDRAGFFQAAEGGTLFLDEVGELPLAMQAKLLRAIQERAVRPVGVSKEVGVDVRLVSATHRDLAGDVEQGRFRQDLYYRLNVIGLIMPPLRERLDDLPLLCEALLRRIGREAGVAGPVEVTAPALDVMARHDFPGNVRELENVLFRVLALSEAPRIDASTVEQALHDGLEPAALAVPTASHAPLPASGEDFALALLPWLRQAPEHGLQTVLDQVEKALLWRALERHHFNRTAAGQSLGLNLRQMRYRMARLGITLSVPEDESDDSHTS